MNSPESEFEEELRALLNKHSQDNYTDTPDWILARYIMYTIEIFRTIIFIHVPTADNTCFFFEFFLPSQEFFQTIRIVPLIIIDMYYYITCAFQNTCIP